MYGIIRLFCSISHYCLKLRMSDFRHHFYLVCSVTILLSVIHAVVIGISSLYKQDSKEVPLKPRPSNSPFVLLGLLVTSSFDLHQRARVCLEGSLQKLLSE